MRHGVLRGGSWAAALATRKALAFQPGNRERRIGTAAPPGAVPAARLGHGPQPQQPEGIGIVPHAEPRHGKTGARKSVVSGKSVSVRVDLGGRGSLTKTKHIHRVAQRHPTRKKTNI